MRTGAAAAVVVVARVVASLVRVCAAFVLVFYIFIFFEQSCDRIIYLSFFKQSCDRVVLSMSAVFHFLGVLSLIAEVTIATIFWRQL